MAVQVVALGLTLWVNGPFLRENQRFFIISARFHTLSSFLNLLLFCSFKWRRKVRLLKKRKKKKKDSKALKMTLAMVVDKNSVKKNNPTVYFNQPDNQMPSR